MSKRKKQQPPPQYFAIDGKPRPLTPIEALILSAFRQDTDDNRFQDQITIAGFLNGGRCFPSANYRACERLATIALRDLVAMGHLVADQAGWLRLAAQPEPQQTKGTTSDE